jgi:hypothetical protein
MRTTRHTSIDFFGIAKNGLDIKSQCLAALKTVARYWGQDRVQHYQWALKWTKFCNLVCAAAREVPEWDKAARSLNLSMFERSQKGMTPKRRPVQDTVSPIEQSDLENLCRHSSGERDSMLSLTPPSSRESMDTAPHLPPGFVFDKFGLMVHEKYAMPALSNTTESDRPVAYVQSVMETLQALQSRRVKYVVIVVRLA